MAPPSTTHAGTQAPARIPEISRQVESIRQLDFKRVVDTQPQSIADFKACLAKEIDRQFGEDGAEAYVQALVTLGVLEQSLDLKQTFLDLLQSQAAAHYDAESETYYLLVTNVPPLVLNLISSHELCHALQDQHFDLYAFVQQDVDAIRDNGDSTSARQALVEGGATLVMTTWLLAEQMGLDSPALASSMASAAVAMQAGMKLRDILGLAEMSAGDPGMAAMGWALDELKKVPRYFVEQLLYVYLQGAMMVDYVKSRGGWKAVNRLYAHPPESTEQVLHPEKLVGKRDSPVNVRLPELTERLPSVWRLLEQDVLGELGIRTLLQVWLDSEAADDAVAQGAAAGWGGDRYYYLRDRTRDMDLLIWKIVWDSWDDASEFTVAYRTMLTTRFPDTRKVRVSERSSRWVYQIWEVEPGRFLKLVRDDLTVGIVDTTDEERLDTMWP